MIKSFRGLLTPDQVQAIRLGTNQGLIGYKMKAFRAISFDPRTVATEAVLQVYSVPQDSATDEINFDDPTLLGVNFYVTNPADTYHAQEIIIFDNHKFNQDIYITCKSTNAEKINYHIELEQMKLDLSEATVATLKDMRGRE